VLPLVKIHAMVSAWLRRHAMVTTTKAVVPRSDRAING
jgi:hypothetical protein